MNRVLDFWVGTPVLNLLATFRRRRKPPTQILRLGVMCSPALGDTLLFSAALQDLRAAYPQAHITHICMKQNLAAAEIIPGADERLLISLTDPKGTIPKLRAQRFDALVDFSSWQRLTAFYSLMSGAKYIAGFATKGMRRSRGYDRTAEHRNDRHEIKNFRALVEGCGLVSAPFHHHEPALLLDESGPMPFAEEPDLIAFHLWASGQNSHLREWDDANWIALAKAIARPETLFLITGGPGDRERSEPFVAAMNAAGIRTQSFVSPDGFRTLTRVLKRCRAVVSVNTGVMHLAAVAGAPTVSLNGPTAEHRWGARGPRVANVQPADGSGGYLHLGFEFGENPAHVMPQILVSQAIDAVRQVEAVR